jgi:hypothetical protein
MEPKDLLLCSQQPTTETLSWATHESSPNHHNLFFNIHFNTMLPSMPKWKSCNIFKTDISNLKVFFNTPNWQSWYSSSMKGKKQGDTKTYVLIFLCI